MDFYEVLDEVIDLLKQRGRTSYSGLKVQFDLDDKALAALKDELTKVHQLAADQNGEMLVWVGEAGEAPDPTSQPEQTTQPDTQKEPSAQVEPPLTEPYTPDAERRQLTILFTDLVDSTKLSSQLDAEDYREIVRAYQAACADVIERYGCHLAQTLGDGLLIYSGYPAAHENDAERAVRVGLGILDAMRDLNANLEKDKDIRLAVRVGIHTGPVVVGDVGAGERPEQLALGEVPNVSARIQGLAAPDTLIISDATYRLVHGYFECEPLGERELRGVAEPVVVHQVLRESGAYSRLDIASIRGLTPLVGREQEVGLLLDRWSQVKDSQGQVLLLSGEAGIGKSRLAEVLKDHVANEPHTRLECRSSPYYQNTALYPITDLLQRTLMWQPNDTSEQRLEKLEHNLSQYRLPLEESVPLFAPLLSIMVPENRYPPLNLSPQRQRQKTLEAILSIIVELAEREPVLFIVEDLHWTDPSTLELLDLLIEQIPTVPIYMLLTCRPEFQAYWATRSYFNQITLNRLSRDDIKQMLARMTGEKPLPNEVIRQLVDKTDGVPLYVEEMTKAVLESGNLKEVEGHYELTSSIGSLSIPATLQDSLMARLDRLVTAKGVAQQAAVIGRQFSYTLLRAVSQLDDTVLERELGLLVDAELVYQRGIPPQATYIFKHALVTDISYESLLRSTRQGYHRRIAEVLTERFAQIAHAQPELVAHHYTEAGFTEQAVDYWQRAGQGASQRSASAEAMGHYEKGLEVLMRLPDTPARAQHELTLHLGLRMPMQNVKGYGDPELKRVLKRTLELCQMVGETAQHIEVLLSLSNFYFTRQELRTAYEMAEQALDLAQRERDPWFLVRAHRSMGYALYPLGHLTTARTHFEQGIALYDPQQHHPGVRRVPHDPKVFMSCYSALVLWALGYPDQARRQNQEGLTLAHTLAHRPSLAAAYVWTAWLARLLRQTQGVQEPAEAAIALATESELPFWRDQGRLYRGWAVAAQGHGEEGVAQMHQGLAALRATGAGMSPLPVVMLAEVYGMDGQAEEGLRVLAEVLPLADHDEDQREGAARYHLKGALLLSQASDNATEAETCFKQAISIAQSQSAKSWELRVATSLSRLWQSQGKHQEAYELLVPVYEWFTEDFL